MSYQFGQYLPNRIGIPAGFCNNPSDLEALVGGNVVTFRWKLPHPVLYSVLSIIEVGQTQNNINVEGSTYTIRLKANTAYQWSVIAICELDPARQSIEIVGVPFETGAYRSDCLPINPASTLVSLLPDKATFSWPAVADAIFYELRYRIKGGFFPYNYVTPQSNSVSIAHLVPNTVYEWSVRPVCKEGGPDHWHDPLEFTTPLTEDQCPVPVITEALVSFSSLIVIWKNIELHQTYDIFLNGLLFVSGYRGNLFTFTNLASNTEYEVIIVPICKAGKGRSVSVIRRTLYGSCPVPGNFTLTWDNTRGIIASWLSVQGAIEYELVLNGEKKTTDQVNIDTVVPQDGRTYFAELRSVCGEGQTISGYSTYVAAEITVPKICPAVTLVNAPVVLSNSIFLDWNNQNGVLNWVVKWKRNIDPDYNEGVTVDNSEYKIEGLLPSTLYDIRITTVCSEGTTDFNTQQTTPVQSGCPVPYDLVATSVTDTALLLNFKIPNTPSFGIYRISITDGVTTITEDVFVSEAVFEGLLPDTEYTVTVQNRCLSGTFSTSAPLVFTTRRACITVTNAVASQAYGSPNVELTWLNTGLVSDFEIDIYVKLRDDPDTDYVKIATALTGTSYTHVVGISLIQQIRDYKIVTRDLEADEECFVEIQMNCLTVQNLKSIVEGNSVTLTWDAVKGAIGYRIRATSLTDDPISQFTKVPSVSFSGLGNNTTYSWFVETVCSATGTGPFSDVATFTTEDGNTIDGDCSMPVFEAKSQSEFFEDESTGDPLPYVYWLLADNDTPPTILPTNSIQTDPEADIIIPFGNVLTAKFYAILYKEADAVVKTKYMDQNNVVNSGDIGGVGDLFNASVISIGGTNYRFICTAYATNFQGTNETVRFFIP
jgi:hypothetical protein